MKKRGIPRIRWMEIYNTILVLRFFMYEYKNNQDGFRALNDRFNDYCRDLRLPGESHSIEGGCNILALGYLVIARISEVVDLSYGKKDFPTRKPLFFAALNQMKEAGVSDFEGLVKPREIELVECTFRNLPEERKLDKLMKHLRHSISHMAYERKPGDIFVFRSKDPKTQVMNLEMTIPAHQFLNLTADLGTWINNAVHESDLFAG